MNKRVVGPIDVPDPEEFARIAHGGEMVVPVRYVEPHFGKSVPDPDGSYWFEIEGGFPIYGADGKETEKRMQYRVIRHTEDGEMVIQAREIDLRTPREAERFGETVWE